MIGLFTGSQHMVSNMPKGDDGSQLVHHPLAIFSVCPEKFQNGKVLNFVLFDLTDCLIKNIPRNNNKKKTKNKKIKSSIVENRWWSQSQK